MILFQVVRFHLDIITSCKIEQKFAEKSVIVNIERGSRGLDVVFVGHRTGHQLSSKACLLKGSTKRDGWIFDGVASGVLVGHQHQLPGHPRLLLLCLAHHQEEPRHQAETKISTSTMLNLN